MRAASQALRWVTNELGIKTILTSGYDTRLVLTIRFLRMFGYGSTALILALFLAALGHSDAQTGLFMTLTLAGDVAISLLLTLVADSLGRRRILCIGTVLIAISGVVFATTSKYHFLLIAAILGVISPGGNEIGPFRPIEESTLAHLSDLSARSSIFAWYVVLATLGTATGSLGAGWLVHELRSAHGWTRLDAYRAVFWMYAATGVLQTLLTLCLSKRCEVQREAKAVDDGEQEPLLRSEGLTDNQEVVDESSGQRKGLYTPNISRNTRIVVFKLGIIFAVDSIASGMMPFSLQSYYIDGKFNPSGGALGSIMSVGLFLSSFSNLFSPALVKRIGFIPAMVVTNLPAAICMALLPLPGSLWLTIVLLLLRFSLNGMDQAPRSAFISAVVLSEERTSVMGILMTVKTLSQSVGPTITGVLGSKNLFWVAFVISGALKVCYNIGLLGLFWKADLYEEDTSSIHEDQDDDAQLGTPNAVGEDVNA